MLTFIFALSKLLHACIVSTYFVSPISQQQLREHLPAHGQADGLPIARVSSYLTNMLMIVFGLPAPIIAGSVVRPYDVIDAKVESPPEISYQRGDEATFRTFQGGAPILGPRLNCVICQDDTLTGGPIVRRCVACAVVAHANCWNQWLNGGRIDAEDEKDPQAGNIAPNRCPGCRRRAARVAPYVQPPPRPIPLGAHKGEDGKLQAEDIKLGDGEELVVHPWALFALKTPRQRVEYNGNYVYRVLVRRNGENVPFILRCMREDDVVLRMYGPVYHVISGTGAYWPRTWVDIDLIHRVGFSVIRHFFSSSDFNDDWCVNQMLSFISREVPLWEDAEQDCRQWIRSETALNYHRTVMLNMVRKKDSAERMKWLKKQMGGELSSLSLEWMYFFFEYLWIVKLVLVGYSLVIPMLAISLITYPHSTFLWILTILYSFVFYRVARICGYLFFEQMPRLRVMNTLAIWKTCSLGVELPDIQDGGRVSIPRNYNVPCVQEKSIEVYGCIIPKSPVVIPNGCAHDMYSAVRIRFLFARREVAATSRMFYRYSLAFLRDVRWASWEWYGAWKWLQHLTPRRRATLIADDDGSAEQPHNWEADIFVKPEAYVGKVWSKFKPRMIQCRKTSLQMCVGPFFYALYKWIARTFSSGKHVYSVNLNALELGSRAALSFGKGVVFEGDASNWDGSVTNMMLRIEQYFLDHIVPYRPVWMTNLLNQWLRTTGSSKGVKYSCDWGRRSGDMWTSTFNTLLNILITSFVWDSTLVEGTYNGDDNWFVVTKNMLSEALDTYQGLGLTMELVLRARWQDLEFCSGLFYQTHRGVKWGLKPFRQLSKFGINFGRHSKKQFKSLLYGNALSMLPIAGHVPVFGLFLRRIVQTAGRDSVVAIMPKVEEWNITDTEVDEIHPEAEVEFMSRYGFTRGDYDRLCSWANKVDIDNFPMCLDDELFLRGAAKDCGFSESPRVDHKTHESWYVGEERTDYAWFPVVEELVSCLFPSLWFVFPLVESCILVSFLPWFGHFVLMKIRLHFGSPVSLIFHLCLNYYIRHNSLSCFMANQQGRLNVVTQRVFLSGQEHRFWTFRKRPGVFTLILDCAGLIKNKLTSFHKISINCWVRLMEVFKSKLRRRISRRIRRRRAAGANNISRRRRGRRTRPLRSLSVIHPYVISKVNPFMAAVNGVRCPDNFGYPTGTAVIRAASQLTVNATGYACKMYLPFVQGAVYTPADVTAGTITWPGGVAQTAPQYSSLQNVASAYRVVSWGLRITADSSLTNSQGHVWVNHLPLNLYTAVPYSDAPDNEADMSSIPLCEKFAITELAMKPVIVVGRAFDDGIYRFRDVNQTTITATGAQVESLCGWCSSIVYISGGIASTTAINVEYIMHIEYLQDGASLYGFVDVVPGCYEPEVMVQASKVEESMPVGIIEDVISTVEAAADYGTRAAMATAKLLPTINAGFAAAGHLARLRGAFKTAPSLPTLPWYEEKF